MNHSSSSIRPRRRRAPSPWIGVGIQAALLVLAAPSGAQPAPAPAAPAPAAPAAQTPAVARDVPANTTDPTFAALAPVPGGLTADQVAQRTLASAASVRAKQAELDAAHAKIDETIGRFLPRLTLRASYTRLSPVTSDLGSGALVGTQNAGPLSVGPCPPPLTGQCVLDSRGVPAGAATFSIPSIQNNYAVGANLSVPISDYVLNLSHATGAAKEGREAAEAGKRAEALKVQTDARELYYNWLRSRAAVAVARGSLDRIRARLKDAEAAQTLGAITKADLMRLQALEANTELMVADADTTRATLEKQLAIVMNDQRANPQYEVGDDVNGPLTPVQGGLDVLLNQALAKRVEVEALDHAAAALHHGSASAQTSRLPRLDAIADVTYANPNPRYFPPAEKWNATWSVGLSATWNLGDVYLQNAVSEEFEANARALEAQRDALRDGLRAEVTTTYLRRERARVAIETSQRALASAEEAYRVATDLYRVGRSTTAELIDAETDLLNARLGDIDARIGMRLAENRLRHAVGADVTR